MLVEKDIQQILSRLASGDPIKLAFDGSDVMIRFVDEASKLSLTTKVYEGDNYIPASVKRCLSHKFPTFSHPSIRTYLTIDEPNFNINLNYIGHTETLTGHHFKEILEEFGWIAEKWRVYLDDHDKHDLVYVKVK